MEKPVNRVQQAFIELGLEPGVPMETVMHRYRKLVRVWHPDRFSSEKDKEEADLELKKINAAREILKEHFAKNHRGSDCECQPEDSVVAKEAAHRRWQEDQQWRQEKVHKQRTSAFDTESETAYSQQNNAGSRAGTSGWQQAKTNADATMESSDSSSSSRTNTSFGNEQETGNNTSAESPGGKQTNVDTTYGATTSSANQQEFQSKRQFTAQSIAQACELVRHRQKQSSAAPISGLSTLALLLLMVGSGLINAIVPANGGDPIADKWKDPTYVRESDKLYKLRKNYKSEKLQFLQQRFGDSVTDNEAEQLRPPFSTTYRDITDQVNSRRQSPFAPPTDPDTYTPPQ